MANKTLARAKDAKDDEFYTQLSDIENELGHYGERFRLRWLSPPYIRKDPYPQKKLITDITAAAVTARRLFCRVPTGYNTVCSDKFLFFKKEGERYGSNWFL